MRQDFLFGAKPIFFGGTAVSAPGLPKGVGQPGDLFFDGPFRDGDDVAGNGRRWNRLVDLRLNRSTTARSR